MSEVDRHIEAHKLFLKKYYTTKNFICSGRKNPRNGGIIIASFTSLDDVNKAIEEDPFFINDIANYSITEFIPSKNAKDILSNN